MTGKSNLKKQISIPARFASRQTLDRKIPIGQRSGWVGLGLFVLFVSYLIWVWTALAHDPNRADMVWPTSAAGQGRMTAAGQVQPGALSQAGPASTLAFRRVFDLGSVDHADNVYYCHDPNECLAYVGPPKIRQIVAKPTFRVIGRSIEVFGRLWWLEEKNRYFVVYLKVTLSEPIR